MPKMAGNTALVICCSETAVITAHTTSAASEIYANRRRMSAIVVPGCCCCAIALWKMTLPRRLMMVSNSVTPTSEPPTRLKTTDSLPFRM